MDILINNAGIFGGYTQMELDSTINQFKAAYDTRCLAENKFIRANK